jgi:two-component system, LuxR family, response regulator FixJ
LIPSFFVPDIRFRNVTNRPGVTIDEDSIEITVAPMKSSIVYIVDDDVSACKSMEALLGTKGLMYQSFPSGEDFLDGIQSCQTASCLLADYNLPGMNGIELLNELARLKKCVSTVIVTAYATTNLTIKAMRSGAITVLDKPLREQELWDEISRALTTSSQRFEVETRMQESQRRLAELTDDEWPVLEMVLNGQPNKSIAKKLDLSIRTIENRRQQIHQKTRTNALAELVKMVVELRVREQLVPKC